MIELLPWPIPSVVPGVRARAFLQKHRDYVGVAIGGGVVQRSTLAL